MPVLRSKKRGRGRPRRTGLTRPASTPPSVPPSLPPVAPETALVSSTPQKEYWTLPEDSKIKKVALQMVAMRIAGLTDDEIAASLGLKKSTIHSYLHKAGKMGWLDLDNAKDQIDYQMMPKVVRNLMEGLDDGHRNEKTGFQVKTAVALEVAKGTVFKQYDQVVQVAPHSTVVAIKIEMPEGPAQQMREDTTGGRPAYVVEGELAK